MRASRFLVAGLLLAATTAFAQNSALVNPQTDASQLTRGTLNCVRTAALTGDTTTSAGSCATTIANAAVTDAKANLAVKPSVCCVATANVTLSGEQTLDGQLTSTSFVILSAQTDPIENGYWTTAAGAWSRPSFYAAGLQPPQFTTAKVRLGTLYQDSTWKMTTAGVTVGTNAQTWSVTPQSMNSTTTNPVTSAAWRAILSDELGTGASLFDGATPTSFTLTNATGLPISSGVSGLGTSVATLLGTPSSANLRSALTDESGTGVDYFQGGDLGTPSAGVLTNATGLPIGGLTGLGTGVGTALAANVTGSGGIALAISPSLTTPNIGVATATTVNKVTLTAPASSSTLTILDGKTLTANKTLTLDGTDSTTMTFPSTSATIARTDAANTFTGVQSVGVGSAAAPTLTVGAGGEGLYTQGSDDLSFAVSGAHAGLFDSAGRFIVGHTAVITMAAANSNIGVFNSSPTISNGRFSNNANAPTIVLGKSRAASPTAFSATPVPVVASDGLGDIRFAGDDGATLNTYGVSLLGEVDTGATVATGSIPSRFSTFTMNSSGSRVRATVVDSSQQLGIGTGIATTDQADARFTLVSPSVSVLPERCRSLRAAIVISNILCGTAFYSNDTNLTAPGSEVADIEAVATETHTASALGTQLRFFVTPNVTTTPAEVLRLAGTNSSAIDAWFQMAAAGTNGAPTLSAISNGTNNAMQLSAKGTGLVLLGDSSTATASAGAATCSAQRCVITSESLTTAAGTDYTLTVTNTKVAATNVITCSQDLGTNTRDTMVIYRVTPGSGSYVVIVHNAGIANAFNGTIKVSCTVF